MIEKLEIFSQHLREFMRKYQKLEQYQHDVKGSDLNMAEVHILVLVGRFPDIHLFQLAEQRQISRSAVTQLVNKLTAKDYLRKEVSDDKKSAYKLILTTKGEKIYDYHNKQHAFLNEKLGNILMGYPDDFIERVEQLMVEIEKVWEELYQKNQKGWD
ncbi:MarR family winged helix-turn-helix transcriptional regulator [Streptococcus dentapri]|uniref:MarR family winged helix-turn-helix transcriptional regulator n=1 Tax=Streptococcus dentapri TaxID=573564 RepID=A0ABV8D1D6_9STRE